MPLLYLAALAAAQSASRCLDSYASTYHANVGGHEFTWMLHQLCSEGADYSYLDPVNNHLVSYNFGGFALQTCAPGYPTYATHGSAVMYYPAYQAEICNDTNKLCIDVDYNVSTCCNGPCNLLVCVTVAVDQGP